MIKRRTILLMFVLFSGALSANSAEKQENIWIVKENYVGPKNCLAYASRFEIILDEKDRFEGIWLTPW